MRMAALIFALVLAGCSKPAPDNRPWHMTDISGGMPRLEFQYLFVQGEFGLMCPISVTDTSIHLIRKFGSSVLQDYLLPKMLSSVDTRSLQLRL